MVPRDRQARQTIDRVASAPHRRSSAPGSGLWIGPPLQWSNEVIADLHPELGPMVLARPQRAHSPLGVDAGRVVHACQFPAAPILRTGPDQIDHLLCTTHLFRSGSRSGFRAERTRTVDGPLCDGRESPTVRRLRPLRPRCRTTARQRRAPLGEMLSCQPARSFIGRSESRTPAPLSGSVSAIRTRNHGLDVEPDGNACRDVDGCRNGLHVRPAG